MSIAPDLASDGERSRVTHYNRQYRIMGNSGSGMYDVYENYHCDFCNVKEVRAYGVGGPPEHGDVLAACEDCLVSGQCCEEYVLERHIRDGHLDHRAWSADFPYGHSAEEKALAVIEPAFERVLAYHKVRLDTAPFVKQPFMALVRGIVGQRIRFSHAQEIFSRLRGEVATPQMVVDMGLPHLATVMRHKSKAETVYKLSLYLVESGLSLINTPEELLATVKHLRDRGVKGLGQWTVDNAMLSVAPDYDLFPCGDVFLQERVQKLLDLPTKPSPAEMREITAKWSPHRGTAAWLLWRWFEDTRYE